MKKLRWLVFASLSVGLLHSCVRERDTDTQTAADYTVGEMIYNNVIELAEDAADKQTGQPLSHFSSFSNCASITHNTLTSPKTVVLDFGTSACQGYDGRIRKGKINISYTGNHYTDSLGTATISFDQYTIDDYQVYGNIQINNKGRNISSQPYYEINIQGKFLKPLVLDTLAWNASRTRIQVQGSTTPIWIDDIYELTGTQNGRNEYQIYYATNITKPLVSDYTCKYINKGSVELQPQGHTLRVINYGDGNCDDDATVLFNKKTYHISLK